MDERPIVCGNVMQGFDTSPFNGKYTNVIDDSPPERKIARNDSYTKYSNFDTSVVSSRTDDSLASNNSNSASTSRFETFVMTGDMIIRTSTPQKKNVSPKSSPSESQKEIATSSHNLANVQKGTENATSDSKKQEAGRKSKIPKPTTKAKPKVSKKSQIPMFKEAQPIIQHPVLSLPKSGLLVSPEAGAAASSALDSVLSRAMPVTAEESVIETLETVESRARPAPVESSPRNSPQITRKAQDISTPFLANGPQVSNIPEFAQDVSDPFPPPPPPPVEYQDNYTSVITVQSESNVPSAAVLSSLPGLQPFNETNIDLPPPPPINTLESIYAAATNFEDLPPPPDDLLQYEEITQPVGNSSIYDQLTSAMYSDISDSYSPQNSLDSQTDIAQPLQSCYSQNGAFSNIHEAPSYSLEAQDDGSINQETPEKQAARSIVGSKSAEKISKMSGRGQSMGVRTSKSHETCLEGSLEGVTLVNIDFEDNMASSVDALHYQQSQTSLDRGGECQEEFHSKSANCSPERRTFGDKHSDKVFMPAFISIDEPRSRNNVKKGTKPKENHRRSMERSPEKEILPGTTTVKPERDIPQSGANISNVILPHVNHVIEGVTVDESSVNSHHHVPIATASHRIPEHNESDRNNSTNKIISQNADRCSNMSAGTLTDAAGASSAENTPAMVVAATDVIVGAAAACVVDKSPSQESEKGSRDSKENEKSQRLKTEHYDEPHMQHIEPLVQIKSVMSESDRSNDEGRYSGDMESQFNTEMLTHTSQNSTPYTTQSTIAPRYVRNASYISENTEMVGYYDSSSSTTNHSSVDTESASELRPSGHSGPESEADLDSMYHQPMKDVDRPSAQRLAKRLYHMDGFKKGDVSKHLSKKNEFAQLVGEEFLKFFSFSDDTLDIALRKFLKQVTVAGETQERERVLIHFSKHYMECNQNAFKSEDACHTLTCALMLLNTDLHGQNLSRKMTLNEFIDNLAELNDGEDFSKEILKGLYLSIKEDPLQYEIEEEQEEGEGATAARVAPAEQRFIGYNPFLEIPDSSKAQEFKKGYVMRKCCVDPDGKRTALGKRSWKMYYTSLRDMVLYMHKDEHAARKSSTFFENASNAIRIHHALATKANDYTKKQHVFRLQTSDWAQYLFQTSNSKELQEWIDTINFVAASLSAPPLPGAVGSQRKFQRPLLPASYTKLNLKEQLDHHEQRVLMLEHEVAEHRAYPPEKGVKSRVIQDYLEKEEYLQFEMKRFRTYVYLLRAKMASYPEYEPSLVETAIGEVDEPPSSPASNRPPVDHHLTRPVQRSMSDRARPEVTYRAEKIQRGEVVSGPEIILGTETMVEGPNTSQVNVIGLSKITPTRSHESDANGTSPILMVDAAYTVPQVSPARSPYQPTCSSTHGYSPVPSFNQALGYLQENAEHKQSMPSNCRHYHGEQNARHNISKQEPHFNHNNRRSQQNTQGYSPPLNLPELNSSCASSTASAGSNYSVTAMIWDQRKTAPPAYQDIGSFESTV